MTAKRKRLKPLTGDPRRQAVAALCGYEYQIWHTVHAWLELKDDDLLVVEGAEDFDVLSDETAIAVQVKATSAKITLRTPAVIEAIVHFWELRKANPDRPVLFRFLTRSEIGVEQSAPFGNGVAGLDLWKNIRVNNASLDLLRKFLVEDGKLPPDLLEFLKLAKPGDVIANLFVPIVWETESRNVEFVEEAVRRKLILHGDKSCLGPSESSRVASRLLKEVFAIATKKNNRYLDRAYFLEIFEDETAERVPRQQIAALRNLATAPILPLAPLGTTPSDMPFQVSLSVGTSIPPVSSDVFPRPRVVNELVGILCELGILVLVGSTGTGKTTLAKLVAGASTGSWSWVSFANREPHQYGHALQSLATIEQGRSIVPTLLTHALAALPAAGNMAAPRLIEKWRDAVPKLSAYNWLGSWFDFAIRAFTVPTAEAISIMGNKDLPFEMRYLSAARLMTDPECDIDRMFNAQVWIVDWLAQHKRPWDHDLGRHLACIIAGVWKQRCKFRAALRNPSLTVPEIGRECMSTIEGVAKAASILLAAANAVTIQLNDELKKHLKTLSSAQGVM